LERLKVQVIQPKRPQVLHPSLLNRFAPTTLEVVPKVFISYRREDSEQITGRIYDRLGDCPRISPAFSVGRPGILSCSF
jgi:hypothetical protein